LWYRYALESCPQEDGLGRGRSLASLGVCRYVKALNDSEAPDRRLLEEARDLYKWALNVLPNDAIVDLGQTHRNLANTMAALRDFDGALSSFQEAIDFFESADYVRLAAETRMWTAEMLATAGRGRVAREYAMSALNIFAGLDPARADEAREFLSRLNI
jgi:tetratricopeptide (TPR) repeat protein